MLIVALRLLLLSLCQCTDENDSISYLKAQVNGPDYEAHDAWTSRRRLPNHEALVQSAGDTFAYLESQHMLREHKNPCWKESSGVLKCMPFFQILGVSKCGTTDLYHRLSFNGAPCIRGTMHHGRPRLQVRPPTPTTSLTSLPTSSSLLLPLTIPVDYSQFFVAIPPSSLPQRRVMRWRSMDNDSEANLPLIPYLILASPASSAAGSSF